MKFLRPMGPSAYRAYTTKREKLVSYGPNLFQNNFVCLLHLASAMGLTEVL